MKTIKNIFLLMIIGSFVTVMSCGGNDDPGPSDEDRFVGTWTASSVTLDNADVTNPSYSNFTITFNDDGSYITAGGDPIFTNTGGFWSITSSTETSFTLSMDGTTVSASFGADDATMTLSFTASDEQIGAKVDGLVGEYVFSLTKQ